VPKTVIVNEVCKLYLVFCDFLILLCHNYSELKYTFGVISRFLNWFFGINSTNASTANTTTKQCSSFLQKNLMLHQVLYVDIKTLYVMSQLVFLKFSRGPFELKLGILDLVKVQFQYHIISGYHSWFDILWYKLMISTPNLADIDISWYLLIPDDTAAKSGTYFMKIQHKVHLHIYFFDIILTFTKIDLKRVSLPFCYFTYSCS
jgi:hypothetical protein